LAKQEVLGEKAGALWQNEESKNLKTGRQKFRSLDLEAGEGAKRVSFSEVEKVRVTEGKFKRDQKNSG